MPLNYRDNQSGQCGTWISLIPTLHCTLEQQHSNHSRVTLLQCVSLKRACVARDTENHYLCRRVHDRCFPNFCSSRRQIYAAHLSLMKRSDLCQLKRIPLLMHLFSLVCNLCSISIPNHTAKQNVQMTSLEAQNPVFSPPYLWLSFRLARTDPKMFTGEFNEPFQRATLKIFPFQQLQHQSQKLK